MVATLLAEAGLVLVLKKLAMETLLLISNFQCHLSRDQVTKNVARTKLSKDINKLQREAQAYIADYRPGGLGCQYRNSVLWQVVALPDGVLIAFTVMFLTEQEHYFWCIYSIHCVMYITSYSTDNVICT